jgi:hypothetical protein
MAKYNVRPGVDCDPTQHDQPRCQAPWVLKLKWRAGPQSATKARLNFIFFPLDP